MSLTTDRRARATGSRWWPVGFAGVTTLAAVTYLFDLTRSGYGNSYYAAAAWAGSVDWTAWFFGSWDPANFITVDKPPLATMVMGLSARLLGLSSWSVMLPQALAGIATTALLFLIVRRSFGALAATIAGVAIATTPVAALIFRYDNPDALLTLLLVAAAGCVLLGLEGGQRRWLVAASILVGLAFTTKFLQAYLVVPALALAWLWAGPGKLRRRVADLVLAAAVLLVASGWWVAAVALTPPASRPYIGGSATNSALELLLGSDGLGRLVGGGGIGSLLSGADGGPSGPPGPFRLLGPELGGQIAWLLPFALVALVAGLATVRSPGRRAQSVAYALWGTWLAVHALVFSFMTGTIHTYYTVALTPAIAALVGSGAADLWRRRSLPGGPARCLPLASAVLATAVLGWVLLGRTPGLLPGLDVAVLGLGLAATVAVLAPAAPGSRIPLAGAVLASAALLAGPAAYTVATVRAAYSGGDPSAGPRVSDATRQGRPVGPGPGGREPSAGGGGRSGPAADGNSTTLGFSSHGQDRVPDAALLSFLEAHRGSAYWMVAVTSADDDGPLELESGEPVMAMGGFKGGDPAPTIAELQAIVAAGRLRYVIVGGEPAGIAVARAAWVTSACRQVDFGEGLARSPLYDCAGAADRASP